MESPYFILYKLSENEMLYWRELAANRMTTERKRGGRNEAIIQQGFHTDNRTRG
jgi:hypothetical protein